MTPEAVALLRCPHCARPLALAGRTVRCGAGHAFDLARQGYVSLLAGDARAGAGDTAAMIAAREAFLAEGHYDGMVAAVVDAAARAVGERGASVVGGDGAGGAGGAVVDIGAGTAHHLARALDALPGRTGLALDVSTPALRRAARAHPRVAAVACDAWRGLPVRDGAAALVLSVFAPRNAAEIARVLRPGGALVVVTPTNRHLRELVEALGLLRVPEDKQERLGSLLEPHLAPEARAIWEASLALGHDDLERLAAMGPSAHHVDPETRAARVAALPVPLAVSASVIVATHRRPGAG